MRSSHATIAIAVVGMFVLTGVLVLLRNAALPASNLGRIAAVTVGSAVLVTWWGYWWFRIMRAKDEYKQHVERASWFWGGLMGLLVSVPVYGFIMAGGLHWLNPQRPVSPDLASAFAHGYMLPVFMQVGGAVIAALWMRFSRR